jgi:hypothetical protein
MSQVSFHEDSNFNEMGIEFTKLLMAIFHFKIISVATFIANHHFSHLIRIKQALLQSTTLN